MAGTAVLRRLTWAIAEVVDRVDETPRVRSLTFDVPDWPGHLPGQHIDVRLTAEDGYQAQRSYSISTPADGTRVTITVERLEDGEVSTYLTDVLEIGDRIELRGPDRRVLRVGAEPRRTAGADRRRQRGRATHGHAPRPRRRRQRGPGPDVLLLALGRGRHLRR